jgi:hypothetical protein
LPDVPGWAPIADGDVFERKESLRRLSEPMKILRGEVEKPLPA